MYQYPNYLMHYGVKGMHWGQRKTRKRAQKDAKEYARAKMYYGQGAGNRRKLISNTVEQRSKDPYYKSEFDKAMAKQDMAKHVSAAKRERKAADIKNTTAKTVRGVVNVATGNIGRASAAAIILYAAARYTGADKVVASYAKQTVSSVIDSAKGAKASRNIWNNMAKNYMKNKK